MKANISEHGKFEVNESEQESCLLKLICRKYKYINIYRKYKLEKILNSKLTKFLIFSSLFFSSDKFSQENFYFAFFLYFPRASESKLFAGVVLDL